MKVQEIDGIDITERLLKVEIVDEAIQPPKWKDSPVSWDFLMYLMGGAI